MNDNKKPKKSMKDFIFRCVIIFLKVLGGLLLILVIIAAIALIRGRLIEVRTYSVPSRERGKVKIVGLADLHGNMLGKDQERIVSKVQAQEPDIIVYLGDMIEKKRAEESIEKLVILTKRLVQIAPVYYVDGNHEQSLQDKNPDLYISLNKQLADAGAVQLDNEMVQLSISEESTILNLCGVSTHYYWEEKEYELTDELKKKDGIKVLICHYPESMFWYEAFDGGGLDLALCGHTHGGLVRVPFKGGLISPEWGWWPPYDLGEYPIYTDTKFRKYGGEPGSAYLGTMIISGGLAGEHGVPRVNNPMEISVVEVGR